MLALNEVGKKNKGDLMNNQVKQAFFKSEKAIELRKLLVAMTKDPMYNTRLRGLVDYPDEDEGRFIEKHMHYMGTYPRMDHYQYVSNLKLKTKITNPFRNRVATEGSL